MPRRWCRSAWCLSSSLRRRTFSWSWIVRQSGGSQERKAMAAYPLEDQTQGIRVNVSCTAISVHHRHKVIKGGLLLYLVSLVLLS